MAKCKKCEQIIYRKKLAEISRSALNAVIISGSMPEKGSICWPRRGRSGIDADLVSSDPLKFTDYAKKLHANGQHRDAVVTGEMKSGEHRVVICAMDFESWAAAWDRWWVRRS